MEVSQLLNDCIQGLVLCFSLASCLYITLSSNSSLVSSILFFGFSAACIF